MAEISNPFETIMNELADIKAEIQKLKPKGGPVIQSDSLTKDQAIQFLTENGLPMKAGQFYFLTSSGQMPSKRIGKRLVLSRKELSTWLESRLNSKPDRKQRAAKLIAESARKSNRVKTA